MAAKLKKLELKQGTKLDFPIYIVAGDEVTPINITGCSIKIQIRTKPADYKTYIHAEFSTTNGKCSISDAVNGKILLNVPVSETRDWKFNDAYFEIEITFPTGHVVKKYIPCFLTREYVR